MLRHTEFSGQTRRHRLDPVTLGRVVSGCNKSHPGFGRQMGLRLRNFTRHKHIHPGCNRGLKVTLRAARAPSHPMQFAPVAIRHQHRPRQLPLQSRTQGLQTLRRIQDAGKTQLLLTKPRIRPPSQKQPELRVIAKLCMRIQGQVVSKQIDIGSQ